jgi:hypothetical protein
MENSQSASGSKSKQLDLFGPPPILYGEDEAAYQEMVAGFSDALGPKDMIEKFWVHDLVNAAWNLIRFRRIKDTFLADKAGREIEQKVSWMAVIDPKLREGTESEKEEMEKLLDPDSELDWDELIEQYPRANEKYEKFLSAAKARLDENLIQAKIVVMQLSTIEQIERLNAIAQHRYDAIIREFDRHRLVQNQLESVKNVIEGKLNTIKPTTAPKIAATTAA